ncbi:MAG: crotonase/enoyl-CoA hydratase family protein [Rhodocyclaceae bacterium]|nr:crotonase/enoyl-CoA hydratase family protein [Rhodocyclaceae bacterium]
MTYNTLATQLDDGIMTLTLNRPDQMNSFTVEMAHELVDFYRTASANDAIRAIVVTGAGKAFCAGMDLSRPGNVFGLDESLQPTLQDMQDRLDDPEIMQGVRDTGGMISLAVYDCTKPVVGAINGAAVGIGATMTLPMDVRLASDKARIGFVFGRIGIVPEACSSWFLPRIVGISQALEWTYCADILSPEEALRGRLIKAIVPHDQLLIEAHKLAHRMTDGRSAVGTALTRQMMYRNAAHSHPLAAHQVDSLAMFYTSMGDGKEGVRSFLEKRPADFQGKVSANMPSFYPWW